MICAVALAAISDTRQDPELLNAHCRGAPHAATELQAKGPRAEVQVAARRRARKPGACAGARWKSSADADRAIGPNAAKRTAAKSPEEAEKARRGRLDAIGARQRERLA